MCFTFKQRQITSLLLFRMNINYTFFYSANPINTSILKIN